MIKANKIQLALAGLTLAALFSGNLFAENMPDPYANETSAQHDARMAWWRADRFGMFIHWGLYSVPAGVYHGKEIPHIGEWIMFDAKIPMAEYKDYAKKFDPTNYNADDWVRLAKEAGMKYIIFTTKHHEGFAMFDTKASDWNIVKATPYGKDVLKSLAAACRKYDMKLGFYYSQAQDWNNGGSSWFGKWDPAQKHDMDDYIEHIAVPEVRELLSNYGEFPDVIWWDTPIEMNQERAAKLLALLKLKPGIIENNRLSGDYDKGDTETPEQSIPAAGFRGRDWESCMTMNDTWGYKTSDHNWKSTTTLVRNLVEIASKGGNYLLNVGPTCLGRIPDESIERLKAIGAWMKVNGDAIYDTTAGPFKRLPWGFCTEKCTGVETRLYLHVFDWPSDGNLLLPGLNNHVSSAWLLADGEKLKVNSTESGIVVNVPTLAPDAMSSTVVLTVDGVPDIRDMGIFQEFDGSMRLLASEGDLHGNLIYESSPGVDDISFSGKSESTASWRFRVSLPGKFKIKADIASEALGKCEIGLDDHKIQASTPVTESLTQFKTVELADVVSLSEGKHTLIVRPLAENQHPMKLKSVSLYLTAQP